MVKTKIRILLIEDNRILREGIAAMLNSHCDFEVVARAEDGDAVRQLKSLGTPPDVILLDLGLEKENSLELMAVLQDEVSTVKVIAMDIFPEHIDIVEFVKAGGSGFILKDATLDDYVRTIKKVAGGAKELPPILTKSLFNQIVETAFENGKSINDESLRLTNREQEIIGLISKGLCNKEIAQHLYISVYTVKSHVHNILEKLALSTRLQIAAFAHGEEFE
ncbi:response regulator transcription factor [bacterium]|nr:response regulator transcription factor [bacterium]